MTALYRAYRPQRFDDVVGQDVVVRTLRNAISQDRVAHAYLFTGPKGTGKTTMAKLLAKCVNCVDGPTVDPCGVCDSCVSIAAGTALDVAEIDAASNTGIDAVRDKIIDTVAFQPSLGTRRVYILDEAHMLSTAAFNALLKTIEEPPPHVLFVFCTTETHKMMATVRDRCQRLRFAPATAEALFTVLERVAKEENITADARALRAITRSSQGSFRNALAALELLTTAFDGTFSVDDVLAHLGVVDEGLIFELAGAILAADAAACLRTVDQLVTNGIDLTTLVGQLAEHLRCVVLAKHDVSVDALAVGDVERLRAEAMDADETRALAAIDALNDAMTRIRIGSEPRLAVEVALVRSCQNLGLSSIALRLAKLEQQLTGSYGQAQGAAPPAAAAPASPAAVPPAATTTAPPKPPRAQAPPPAPPAPSGAATHDLRAIWQAVSAAVPSGGMRAVFATITPLAFEDGALAVSTPTPALINEKLRDVISTAASAAAGCPVHLELRAGAQPASPAAAAAPPPLSSPSPSPAAAADPARPAATPPAPDAAAPARPTAAPSPADAAASPVPPADAATPPAPHADAAAPPAPPAPESTTPPPASTEDVDGLTLLQTMFDAREVGANSEFPS